MTYHGPGQVVGCPLVPLDSNQNPAANDGGHVPKADYVGYVRKLEQTLISALALLKVVSGMTGVWVQRNHPTRLIGSPADRVHSPAKIASIGVKVDANRITRHGFSLNVNPDMSYWEGIIACGLIGYPITCLAELVNPLPEKEKIIETIVSAFGNVFAYEMVEGNLVAGKFI